MKSNIVLTFAILFMTILPYSCDNKSEKEYTKAISNADTLFSQNNYDEAKKAYSRALQLNPDDSYPAQKIEEINIFLELQVVNDQYNRELKTADSLFNQMNYSEAKFAYIRANKIKSSEQFPIDMILKIQELQLEIERKELQKNNTYHMIVGSFEVESNATNLQSKLVSLGYDSKIMPGRQGYHRVTYSSFPDIHAAYNKLSFAFKQGYNDAWILYDKN